MELLRRDPFREMEELRSRIDKIFEEFLGSLRKRELGAPRAWLPPVDIYDAGEELVVEMDLPGVGKERVEIHMDGDTLTVRGERKRLEEEGRRYARSERVFGPFERSFSINIPVKVEGVRASYENGVLTLRLPKAEEAKPRRVKVEVE